jgi:hypothetical protein
MGILSPTLQVMGIRLDRQTSDAVHSAIGKIRGFDLSEADNTFQAGMMIADTIVDVLIVDIDGLGRIDAEVVADLVRRKHWGKAFQVAIGTAGALETVDDKKFTSKAAKPVDAGVLEGLFREYQRARTAVVRV